MFGLQGHSFIQGMRFLGPLWLGFHYTSEVLCDEVVGQKGQRKQTEHGK